MSERKHLLESVAEAPVKRGNRWRVIVARPGQGSSGYYSEDLFRRDAHKIIAPGGQAFINHDDSRNPKDMIGTYPEGSRWSEEDRAVVSELEVFSHWKQFVEEVGPHCGISLYALGEADEDGNVTAFLEDALNGADLVARPGLVGSGLAEKLYESARAQADEKRPGARQAEQKKEITMDDELKETLKGISEALAILVAEKKAADTSALQIEADKAAVTSAVEAYANAVHAIEQADLLEPQRLELLEAAKSGGDISQRIESAKKVKEAAVEAASRITESAGYRDFGKSETRYGAYN